MFVLSALSILGFLDPSFELLTVFPLKLLPSFDKLNATDLKHTSFGKSKESNLPFCFRDTNRGNGSTAIFFPGSTKLPSGMVFVFH